MTLSIELDLQTNICHKMSLSTVLLPASTEEKNVQNVTVNENNTNIGSNKPFYLYRGLSQDREEEFKIYPVVDFNSACSSLSSTPLYDYDSTSEVSNSNTNSDIEIEESHNPSVNSGSNSSIEINYRCNHPQCRYKGTFLSKDYLRRHIREQHRRTKEHVCTGYKQNGEKWGCDKKFSRPYQLVNHWRGQRSLKRCGVPETELKKRGVL